MSMDPQAIQQLLMQRLQQPGMAGGGGGGPQMQGAMSAPNAAAQLAQKVMLMKALQARAQQGRANSMMPATNAQIARDPQMLSLQQPPPMMQAPPMPQPGVPSSQ